MVVTRIKTRRIGIEFTGRRNKSKYNYYECNYKRRTNDCTMKSVNKDYLEDIVIDEIEKKLLNSGHVDSLIEKIPQYSSEQCDHLNKRIKSLESDLSNVNKKIESIVNAIASGMFHSSMKVEMDTLESEKMSITSNIEEIKFALNQYSPDIKFINNI